MPHVSVDDGTRIFYQLDGAEGRPVLLLSNSLGTALEMWAPQLTTLAERFRVLRYDSRGHGRSDVPPGPYGIARLGRDALALLDGLGIDRAAFAGVSKGGMVGMWLGVNAPERITHLALCNTSAHVGAPEVWDQRIATVRAEGMAAIVPGVIDRWFTKRFQAAEPVSVEQIAAMLRTNPPEGYAACCAAVRDMDQRVAIRAIRVPTLVIAGQHDLATPPDHARLIAESIARARYVELDAAHLSNIEQAGPFTRHLLDFLTEAEGPGMDERERHEQGLAVRRRVLGGAHVERAQQKQTPFTEEFQDLITRYAWGEIWTRPGLDHRTRRCMTLAMMLALGHWDEFQMHVRAAVGEGGFSREDIKEVLLQAAIYCGVPVANHGFKLAEETYAAMEGE